MYPSDPAVSAVLLAPGAGGGQRSHFMLLAARELAARQMTVATFDFPYMTAGRKAPDRPAVLERAWRDAIESARREPALQGLPLFIGGKSMGGRIASHVAAQGVRGIRGLVCLGYPLHPPGRPQQRRDAHLPAIAEPILFVQGTRDEFGTSDEIRALLPRLNRRASLHEVRDGDHSFNVRVSIARAAQSDVLADVFDAVAAFVRSFARP